MLLELLESPQDLPQPSSWPEVGDLGPQPGEGLLEAGSLGAELLWAGGRGRHSGHTVWGSAYILKPHRVMQRSISPICMVRKLRLRQNDLLKVVQSEEGGSGAAPQYLQEAPGITF